MLVSEQPTVKVSSVAVSVVSLAKVLSYATICMIISVLAMVLLVLCSLGTKEHVHPAKQITWQVKK